MINKKTPGIIKSLRFAYAWIFGLTAAVIFLIMAVQESYQWTDDRIVNINSEVLISKIKLDAEHKNITNEEIDNIIVKKIMPSCLMGGKTK